MKALLTKQKMINKVILIPEYKIKPNPYQPRKVFDEEKIEQLATSIAQYGLLQPITVLPMEDGNYQLVAGERRLLACRRLKMQEVPAILTSMDEERSSALALVENIQRCDLNYFEEAMAIQKLMKMVGYTQQAVAKKLGKNQSTVANKLRLLQFSEEVREAILEAGLTERHARALLNLNEQGDELLLEAGLRWGVVGAGVATVAAEGISALLCARHIYRKIPLLHLGLRELKIDRRLLGETVSSGAITALQQACQPIGKALIQSVMNAQGVSVIAAFNAVSRVDDFACIPEQSISSSMMTCIAQNRGAGEHARVGETLRRGMMIEAAYGVLICAAVLLVKEPVMRLFAAQDSMQMVSMGVDYLTLMAFFYILPGITNGIQGYFRGMGEMKTTLVATFIQISIRALVVAVLVPRVGLNGAAWACAIGWSAMLCYTFARYRKVRTNE